jgi:superoxide dismutase
VLPELPYDYAALEPAIIGEIDELHHDKHHATYAKGANDTLDKIDEARDNSDFAAIVGLGAGRTWRAASSPRAPAGTDCGRPQPSEQPPIELEF